MKKSIFYIFALAATMVLFGCSTKTVNPYITVYTALEDDQLAAYLKLFTEKHPDIRVDIVRNSTGVIIAKILAVRVFMEVSATIGLCHVTVGVFIFIVTLIDFPSLI